MNKHITTIQLRFSDVDMLQHVNNAKFATYMELARIKFFDDIIASGHNWRELGIIVAAYGVEFKAPIYYTDVLYLETSVTEIGTKSFKIEYRFIVDSETGPIEKATGTTTMVCFHYLENKSVAVPKEWREKINAFQNTSL